MWKFRKNNQQVISNSSNSISSSLITKIIFYISLFILVALLIRVCLITTPFSGYVFQEWLINYSEGFVRRGLSGTFLLFMQKQYNVDIYKVVKFFAYLTFLLFSSIYLLKVRKSRKILNWESLMVVLFLPSLIIFPINDPHVIGRKDFFFFFGLLINIFLVEKTLRNFNIESNLENSLKDRQSLRDVVNQYCYSLFIWYNLLSIPTTLIHEGIIFLALPLNIIIASSLISLAFSRNQLLLRTLIIFFPTILVSFLCIAFKGNDSIALGICQSWQQYSHNYSSLWTECHSDQLPEVLRFLGSSTKEAIRENWDRNFLKYQGLSLLKWIFTFLIITIVLMRASSQILIKSVEKLKRKFPEQDNFKHLSYVNILTSFTFKYAFIPFIFSFILYIIALDWGRWLFIISTTYTLCILSPCLILLEVANYHQKERILIFLSPVYSIYSKIINFLYTQSFLQRFYIIYFLMFIFALFLLKIPHIGTPISHIGTPNFIQFWRQDYNNYMKWCSESVNRCQYR